jgi:DEAD/DEAH box helicase domain-containing protein
VIEALLKDPEATALYLYPLKALANDQLAKLLELERSCDVRLVPRTYDGDTPSGRRSWIKQNARIVLTNPYALHQYLPWHPQWARIFANLQAIVIDEAHYYRGLFGANVAHLLRRLLRIVAHYGATPRIVLSSASIANPELFGRALIGRDRSPSGTPASTPGARSRCKRRTC